MFKIKHIVEGSCNWIKRIIANQYFAGANFPNIVANVVDAKNGNPILTPYKVLKIHGIPIGFIGVVTTDTPIITMPSNVAGVKFIDEVEAINRYVPELKRHGVRSIIVLAHDPGTSDINGTNDIKKSISKLEKSTWNPYCTNATRWLIDKGC